MADRRVTGSGKDDEGDITSLCGSWGSVDKQTAIREIENSANHYFVQEVNPPVDVRVVVEGPNKYLRTTPDSTSKNNLDNLPDC